MSQCPTRVVEGIHVDPHLAEIEDIRDSFHIAGGPLGIGLVVMFFTWDSWWIVIAIVLLALGVFHLVDGARKAWRMVGSDR